MNKKITHIFARYILDSRANPTVEVEVTLDDGSWAVQLFLQELQRGA